MLPDVAVHGTWVRSLIHDGFGRLVYKEQYNDDVQFLVMWEKDEALDPRRPTASYHSPEDLMVRPYKPRPWLRRPPKVVIYDDNLR